MKITAESIKAAEKVLADNGIEEDEVQSVMQAVGYALADVELYPAPEYDLLDWLADACKARDAARDYVERIWNTWLREDEIDRFRDYWIVDDKIRISYERRSSSGFEFRYGWSEYPASIFASEADAEQRVEEWKKVKAAEEKAESEARRRESQENVRQNELAELKRLKEKYEGGATEGDVK